MVVGQAGYAGPQLDAARALGSGGHKNFRGADRLPAGTVVLADIGFIEAQHVEPLDDLQVTLQGQGRVFPWPVEGRHEHAELHSGRCCHKTNLSSYNHVLCGRDAHALTWYALMHLGSLLVYVQLTLSSLCLSLCLESQAEIIP